jgi:phosphomannomutase/phosphoglucomutase
MLLNPQIFREYDIRGIVDKDFDEKATEELGKAIGSYLQKQGKKEVVVGGDNRLSTERLRKALIEGLLHTGIDVLNIGIVPTPVFYFSIIFYKKEGGVQITASHNPPEYNGFKVCKDEFAIYGEEIQKLKDIILSKDYIISQSKGRLEELNPIADYINTIKAKINLTKQLKIVIDAGNGTAGLVALELLKDLGCEVIELYCEPDGRFPYHFPDPTIPEFMQDLIIKVKEEKADLGVGYDGDADRIGVVDDKGNIIWGDKLMVLFYKEILRKYKGAPCLIEVKCSQALYEMVEKYGGKPLFYKTGHSLIKAKMKELNSPFAGEMSGHMFFKDEYYGFDDAIYATCRLLRILSNTSKSLSELLQEVPYYWATPEIRVNCPDTEKERVVQEVSQYFKERYECIDIDGIRVLFEDGWALLRKSNTSPQIILRFEAKTENRLKEIKDLMIDRLKPYKFIDIHQINK